MSTSSTPAPISQGLSKILTEKESSTFVYYEDIHDAKRNRPKQSSLRSRRKKRKLHQSCLPCVDLLSDRIVTPLISTVIFLYVILDGYLLLFFANLPSLPGELDLYACASTLVGETFGRNMPVTGRFFAIVVRLSVFLPILMINSFPVEKGRRKSRMSWCTRILFVLLVLIVFVVVGFEVYNVTKGSMCLAEYTARYDAVDEQVIPEIAFKNLFLIARHLFAEQPPHPLNQTLLEQTREAAAGSSSWLSRALNAHLPVVLESIATTVRSKTDASTPPGSKPTTPLTTNTLHNVDYILAPGLVVQLIGEPRTAFFPTYPWMKTWIVLRYVVTCSFLLLVPALIIAVLLQCCGLNLSYERFKQWTFKRYTRSLFVTQTFPKSYKMQQEYQKFIDQDERAAPVTGGNAEIELDDTANQLSDDEDYTPTTEGWNVDSRIASRSNMMESVGVKGFIRALFDDAMEVARGDKHASRTKLIMSRRIGFLDVIPSQRMIMAFVSGIFLMVLSLVIVHAIAYAVYVFIYDAIIIATWQACDPEMLFHHEVACPVLSATFGAFHILMDISHVFTMVLVPVITLSMVVHIFIGFRKNITMHRRGLERICSVRRIDANIAQSSEFAATQAFHLGIGSVILYVTILGVLITVWGVIMVVVLLIKFRAERILERFYKVLPSLAVKVSAVIITFFVFKVSKIVYKIFYVHKNTLFKNPQLHWMYDAGTTLAVVIYAPVRAFVNALLIKLLKDLLFYQRIDFRSSLAYTKYAGFFLTEAFYGNPVLNTFVNLMYQNCLGMEKEEENCFDHEMRRKLRQNCRRNRVSRFLMGALMLKNQELRASRLKENISMRSRKEILKAKLKKITTQSRKSTYTPPDGIQEWYDRTFTLAYEDTVFYSYPTFSHILPWSSVFLYIIMVFYLPRFLPKSGFKIKWVFFLWNIFLSVFSLVMFLGVLVPYVKYIYQAVFLEGRGIQAAVCGRELALDPNPMKFWAYAFCWSKYIELVDTFLMILKNPTRRPIFLHWYHHATVLLFTWYASNYQITLGWPFVVMNTLVHTFMYYYYAVTEIGMRPKWAKTLTMGQTTQMVFGLIFNGLWAYYILKGECFCWQDDKCRIILVACTIMYGSYFILFSKLFVDKYMKPQKPRASQAQKTKSKKIE